MNRTNANLAFHVDFAGEYLVMFSIWQRTRIAYQVFANCRHSAGGPITRFDNIFELVIPVSLRK